jgi:GH15 family glucan-1,4-alpha-glucosidase
MPEWRKILEVEDSDFGAIHRGQGRLEPADRGRVTMCSFWLVEALTRSGLAFPEKLDQARFLFERVLGYANHLGLYSEQSGPQRRGAG